MSTLQLEPRHLSIIHAILKKYPYQFYAFGSRVKGTARKLSDLDLCLKEQIPLNILTHIREDFEESNLPFNIDIVIWQQCAQEFQASIAESLTEILVK